MWTSSTFGCFAALKFCCIGTSPESNDLVESFISFIFRWPSALAEDPNTLVLWIVLTACCNFPWGPRLSRRTPTVFIYKIECEVCGSPLTRLARTGKARRNQPHLKHKVTRAAARRPSTPNRVAGSGVLCGSPVVLRNSLARPASLLRSTHHTCACTPSLEWSWFRWSLRDP